QRKGEHRDVFGLLQHPALRVVKTGGEITRFVQDRRARGSQQGEANLLGDRLEATLQHRCKNGIDRGHGALPPSVAVSTHVPTASMSTWKPSGTTTVVLTVSISAGPSNAFPCRSRSPS